MMRLNAIITTVAMGAFVTCRTLLAFSLDLNLSPNDFTRHHVYSATSSGAAYTDAIFFTLPGLSISSGDPVDVRANLLQPVRMEDYFNGAPFSAYAQLMRGNPPPTFPQTFSSSLTLPGAQNLALASTEHTAWSSVPSTFRQFAILSVTPTAEFGQISALEWHYTAPSWTPPGGSVNLQLSFQIVYGSGVPFADPERNLVTFLPEPAAPTLAAMLFPLMIVRRRRPRAIRPCTLH
jgi:hypothetical protein